MSNKEFSKDIVIQSNELLEAPLYNNVLQLKVFSKVIVAIRKNKDEEIYTFPVNELLETFEAGKNNYAYLKKECKKMFRVIDLSVPDKKGFHLSVLFTNIILTEKGFVSFKVNPELKPLILDLSKGKYTKYYLENISRLRGIYSIRIYELLKQYQKIGYRKIKIDDLKYFLAIDMKKYGRYNDLKRKVIIPSQKELEEKTDIKFTFEDIKTGRKITHIKFNILPNDNDFGQLESSEKILFDKLVKLGINKNKACLLCEQYSEERLKNNIRYVEEEIKKGKNKSNLGGFLISAITGDYYHQTDLFESDKEEEKRQEKKKKDKQKKVREQIKEKENNDKKNKKRKDIEGFLAIAGNEILVNIDTKFVDEYKKSLTIGKHLKEGVNLSQPIVKFEYYEFVFKNYMLKEALEV